MLGEFLCDGLGACLGECPIDVLKIIERETEEFDEYAVEENLKRLKDTPDRVKAFTPLACGCPSHQLREFEKVTSTQNLKAIPLPLLIGQFGLDFFLPLLPF